MDTSNYRNIVDISSLTQEDIAYLDNFDLSPYGLYDVTGLGKFFINGHDDFVKYHIVNNQVWEVSIHALILIFSRPGSTVVDVGSFIGTHMVTMSQSVGPTGKVLAFEPCLLSFAECVMNALANNCDNVQIHRLALSNKEMQGAFVIENENAGATNHLLLPLQETTKRTEPIQIKTLDSFHLTNVSLIKIDVEGLQYDVIAGAMDTIAENHPVLIFEAHDPAWQSDSRMATILQDLGYTTYHIFQSDWIAVPNAPVGSNSAELARERMKIEGLVNQDDVYEGLVEQYGVYEGLVDQDDVYDVLVDE